MITLSPHQKQTLWNGNEPLRETRLKLIARPGTGKTQTLCAYAIERAGNDQCREEYQGIALLSYTNVARVELQERIKNLDIGHELLEYPNYVGTFDSFINNHIFLPFGARFMKCGQRPKLVGEPFSTWHGLNESAVPSNRYHSMYFDCYTLDMQGAPHKLLTRKYANGRAVQIPTKYPDKITKLKTDLFSQGYALQADANYIAYLTLKENPDLRKLIAKRFPVIIIDEAQDLTETQHAILDLICNDNEANLETCILIGDNAQAIYEWNTARPDLLTDKPDFMLKELSETFRCSGAICNLLNKLTNDNNNLSPAGKNTDYKDEIKTLQCDLTNKEAIKSTYADFLDYMHNKTAHDGKKLKLAVLSRSKALAGFAKASILNLDDGEFCDFPIFSNPQTKDFLRVAYYLQKGDKYRSLSAYERYWKNRYNLSEEDETRISIATSLFQIEDFDIGEYREKIAEVLEAILKIVNGLNLVSEFSNISVTEVNKRLIPSLDRIVRDCSIFKANSRGDEALSSLFTSEREKQPFHIELKDGKEAELHIGTVHSVKGETYDGVLYLSRNGTAHSQSVKHEQGNTWEKILTHDVTKCEEKRVVYVALSRAAQTLWIAGEDEITNYFESTLASTPTNV